MRYRVIFPDHSFLIMKTLTFSDEPNEGRAIKGLDSDGHPVWIGTYLYIKLVPENGEFYDPKEIKRMGF